MPLILNCLLIYRLPLMLLYSLLLFLPFAGDAFRRTPRSPWPSSEYHILPHSCLPFTDGEQLKREKCFYGKNVSTDCQRSLSWDKLSKCVFVHGSVYVCDSVHVGERRGVEGFEVRWGAYFFWGLFLSKWWLCLCLCWPLHVALWWADCVGNAG